MNKKNLFIFFTLFFFLILYFPVINTYFTQDDFFHFKIAQTDGFLKGLLYLVGFHPFEERQIAFYRPLFRDLLYHFSYIIFKLNHFPLRILSLIIHLTNALLVWKLIFKIFKSKLHAYLTSFFYTITASNVATLYYLAGGIQVLGALMLMLITLLIYFRYLTTGKGKYIFFVFIAFILALASHEQSYILPFLLLGFYIIGKKGKKTKRNILFLLPFFITLFLYLYLNYFIIGYSKNEVQYQTLFDPKRTLNSLIWYSGWAMGLPEMLIDFAPSLIKLDPRLMRYWGEYFRIILPTFFISSLLIFYMAINLVIKKTYLLKNKYLILLIFWYIAGLLPVIFLPSHKSGHYLTVVLPAFWGIIGYVGSNFYYSNEKLLKNKILLILTIISLITLSSATAVLGKNFFWAAQRGRLSKKIINQIVEKYPALPKGATIYIKNDPDYPYISEDWGGSSKQIYYILNGSDALQLLYDDLHLKVLYEDYDRMDQNTYQLMPKIY